MVIFLRIVAALFVLVALLLLIPPGSTPTDVLIFFELIIGAALVAGVAQIVAVLMRMAPPIPDRQAARYARVAETLEKERRVREEKEASIERDRF